MPKINGTINYAVLLKTKLSIQNLDPWRSYCIKNLATQLKFNSTIKTGILLILKDLSK